MSHSSFPLENTLTVVIIELCDICVSCGSNIDFIKFEQTKQLIVKC